MNSSNRVVYQCTPNRPNDQAGELQLMLMSSARVLMPPMLISGLAMPEMTPEAVREMVAQDRASPVLAQRSSRVWAFSAWMAWSSVMST